MPTGLVLISLIVVMAMPPPTIMVSPMVIVVVLVVPVSLMAFPALAVVVIVGMNPVCTFKRRTFPTSSDPLVMVTHRPPISFDPHEFRVGRRPGLFINDCWWRGPDVHRNLC